MRKTGYSLLLWVLGCFFFLFLGRAASAGEPQKLEQAISSQISQLSVRYIGSVDVPVPKLLFVCDKKISLPAQRPYNWATYVTSSVFNRWKLHLTEIDLKQCSPHHKNRSVLFSLGTQDNKKEKEMYCNRAYSMQLFEKLRAETEANSIAHTHLSGMINRLRE